MVLLVGVVGVTRSRVRVVKVGTLFANVPLFPPNNGKKMVCGICPCVILQNTPTCGAREMVRHVIRPFLRVLYRVMVRVKRRLSGILVLRANVSN